MYNLLIQWMEYLPLQLPLVEPQRDFAELYQSISINLIRKKYVLWFIFAKNTYAYSFMWLEQHWVCHIDRYHSDKMLVHRDALVNRYTPKSNHAVKLVRPLGLLLLVSN